MLERIDNLIEEREDFAFETTLATKSYKNKITFAQAQGYHVVLLFFWLRKVELAIERVKLRVIEGGHNIDSETIKRRYKNGIKKLFSIYLPIVNEAMIFDNSDGIYEIIAEKSNFNALNILNELKFNILKIDENL